MGNRSLERGTIWCCVLLAALTAGCRITRRSDPPGIDQTLIQRSYAERGWLVLDGLDRVIGTVVRYEEPTGAQRFLYTVRNLHGQDMGVVDRLGRAFRYRPHADPEWLSSGPVLAGVLAILGQGEDGSLREVTLEELETRASAATGR